MESVDRNLSPRMLLLITTPKLAGKALKLYKDGGVPLYYKLNAMGTASSEMMDILGLGTPEKSMLLSLMEKAAAGELMRRLRRELRLGTRNSGIAVTLPLSGASNLVLRLLRSAGEPAPPAERKDGKRMDKYAMILAIVNQGYSEDVMNAARSAGAGGGTVLHSLHIGSEKALSAWGLGVQEEKDVVMIITDTGSKLAIMQAVSAKCGTRSEACGMVVSLPIDSAIGLDDYE